MVWKPVLLAYQTMYQYSSHPRSSGRHHTSRHSILSYPVAAIWILDIFLIVFLLLFQLGTITFKSSIVEYANITADPYDGMTMPIAYIPNWLHNGNTDETLTFQGIAVNEFIPMPDYHLSLSGVTAGSANDRSIARYTYSTPYMGSYRGNHVEYDGSHLGVDIRAPTGTPVLAIANGVVVHADSQGATADGKYIVIRNDNIPVNGIPTTLYSCYLHLSAVGTTEGSIVRRGDPIGAVGMTGNATAPHLHFQIDRADAPFHAYWPYTLKEAQVAGLDFFSAVSAGLGKEKAMRYTVSPVELIESNLATSSSSFVANASTITNNLSGTSSAILDTTTPVEGTTSILSASVTLSGSSTASTAS